jgi:hypothetical protein
LFVCFYNKDEKKGGDVYIVFSSDRIGKRIINSKMLVIYDEGKVRLRCVFLSESRLKRCFM